MHVRRRGRRTGPTPPQHEIRREDSPGDGERSRLISFCAAAERRRVHGGRRRAFAQRHRASSRRRRSFSDCHRAASRRERAGSHRDSAVTRCDASVPHRRRGRSHGG